VVHACFSFRVKIVALTDVVMTISYGKLKLVDHVMSKMLALLGCKCFKIKFAVKVACAAI